MVESDKKHYEQIGNTEKLNTALDLGVALDADTGRLDIIRSLSPR
jgi:hypothetical protein